MKQYVTFEHEMYEVINAFPHLRVTVERHNLKEQDIVEGKSISDILLQKGFSEDEVDVLVRRFNVEINNFLKDERAYAPESNLKEQSSKKDLGIQFL